MAAGRHETAFIVGALIGSVAGAAYGLLNAPQAGWRTRADLSGYAEALGDRLAARLSSAMLQVRVSRDVDFEREDGERWVTTFDGAGIGASANPVDRVIDQTTSPTEREGVSES